MPDPNQTHKPFRGSSNGARGLLGRAGSNGSQHVPGPLLVCHSDIALPLQKEGGCHTAVQGFYLFLQNWIAVLMVPLHSNASEPQESLGCQGKQKSSPHTHDFLKIVSSNLASGHLSVLSFVFSYTLCSALSCWGSATLQSFLLFQKCSAGNYWQPHNVITGTTTCKGDLVSLDRLKFSHSRTQGFVTNYFRFQLGSDLSP